jgi:hypothetical protein
MLPMAIMDQEEEEDLLVLFQAHVILRLEPLKVLQGQILPQEEICRWKEAQEFLL